MAENPILDKGDLVCLGVTSCVLVSKNYNFPAVLFFVIEVFDIDLAAWEEAV